MSKEAPAAFRIRHEDVVLEGKVFAPAGEGPHPAVLMFSGGAGPGKTFWRATRQLAEHGFLAVGVDMYGAHADMSTPKAAGAYFEALLRAPETLRARVVAWFEAVSAREDVDAARVHAIGYCFGGKCVLELARSGAAARSVTSFHGLLKSHAPARSGEVRARVAIWSGGRDPHAPIEDFYSVRAEFEAARADCQATLFSWAQHSFTDPDHDGFTDGIAYDKLAHDIAWAGTLALLAS